jgi:hypothetical protein
MNVTYTMCRTALVAVALATAPLALAGGPHPASPEVKKALEKAAESPDELRRFVQRTRMIYALNYDDVMNLHEAAKTAGASPPSAVASAPVR